MGLPAAECPLRITMVRTTGSVEHERIRYLTYSADAANVLFQVVDHRHLHKKPMVFTTNVPSERCRERRVCAMLLSSRGVVATLPSLGETEASPGAPGLAKGDQSASPAGPSRLEGDIARPTVSSTQRAVIAKSA